MKNKKITIVYKLTFSLLVFFNLHLVAQNTYVPDNNFEQALIDLGYDTVLDDYVSTANINTVTELSISNKNIANLTGIQDFTALINLNCNDNSLTNLDLSQNTVLAVLRCVNNQLTSLNVKNGNNTNFSSFFAFGNPNLSCIEVDDAAWSTTNWTSIDATSTFSEDCSKTYVPDNNFEQVLIDLGYDTILDDYVPTANIETITILDIPDKNIADLTGIQDFSALTQLWCYNNQLSSLDISQNTALNILSCRNNQFTSLDLSQNTALTSLGCSSNQLTGLDISQNTALTNLSCSNNQLTSLDVSQSTVLTTLLCQNNQLSSLNVKNGNNTNFNNFRANNNPNLTCIEVDNAAWSTTNWTNIDATAIFSEDCSATLTYVPDDNFEQALIDLGYDTVLDDYVPTANINTVTHLSVFNKNITDLTGIEGFTALEELYCYINQLTSLDLSQNTALTVLNCTNNQLTSLDLSKNTALTTLISNNNQLTSLDVSHNTLLNKLQCLDNQLNILDVNQNTALTELFCYNNQLTSLDISQNTVLTALWCNNNRLTSLNVKNDNNINFTSFKAKNNPNLTCIIVDDATWSTANWTDIDATSTFVNNQTECDVLAVSDEVLNNTISIYPNPASTIFKTKSESNISNITVFDSLGRLILQFNHQESYNISNLTQGIYFIRLKSDEKVYQQKLIIN